MNKDIIYNKKFLLAVGAFATLVLALLGNEFSEQVKQAWQSFIEIMSALD